MPNYINHLFVSVVLVILYMKLVTLNCSIVPYLLAVLSASKYQTNAEFKNTRHL